MILDDLASDGTHVLPLHAEVEGGIMRGDFIQLIRAIKELGCRIMPLSEIHSKLDRSNLVTRKYRMELLSGRSVPCAV